MMPPPFNGALGLCIFMVCVVTPLNVPTYIYVLTYIACDIICQRGRNIVEVYRKWGNIIDNTETLRDLNVELGGHHLYSHGVL